jgi:hypothetical protein
MVSRRVHTVHLTAPSDTLLRRGEVLLEDAMHTASLPETDGGRLWLVRSLNVGKISSKDSAAKLAISIEQQFRHVQLSAVHGSDPTAAIANIVYFNDISDAYCCFALRLTQPAPIHEWFWRSVLPNWQPSWSRQNTLKLILSSILQIPPKVMALVELCHRLQKVDKLELLLEILTPSDGEVLLQACGWARPDLRQFQHEQPLPEQVGSQSISTSAIAPPMLITWLRRWGMQDYRSHWLAAIWLLIDQPYRQLDSQLLQHTIDWMQLITRSPQTQSLDQKIIANSISTNSVPTLESIRQSIHQIDVNNINLDSIPRDSTNPLNSSIKNPVIENEIDELGIDQKIIVNSISTNSVPTLESIHQSIDQIDVNNINLDSIPRDSTNPQTNSLPYQQLHRSPYAGFFGVIPLLNQLGLLHRCDQLHLDFPAHLLSHLAITFGIPELDPIRQLLISQDLDGLFRGVEPMTVVTSEVIAWIAAMRFWCRRYVGMTIAELIGRSGRFTLTRTHLDIFFQHDQADIRIRRAGLDLDPGWVPWLGRVVLFHYSNE